ncbi:MAG TPA: NTP transferase domain-containing protein [Gemmatimonadales bacterium]|nr:NTP transferase domain-containing protein [Gemmatimonadales bacterium]
MSGPSPTLVILAAGMATRYGGVPKQLEPVGPGGGTLMDYSLHDARRAGFKSAVLVIRPELEPVFRERLVPSWMPTLPITLVYQEIAAPRTRPWGTGQAVLVCRTAVSGPFAVINADDFYGRSAIVSLRKFLAEPPTTPPTAGLVGYPLAATLSEAGGVTRAVLHADGSGWLDAITEVRGIRDPAAFSPGTVVSMNAWAFPASIFDLLDARFADFQMGHAGDDEEFLLPTAVQDLIRRKGLRCKVLAGGERWIGVTYPADRPRAEAFLRAETAGGTYPAEPWR